MESEVTSKKVSSAELLAKQVLEYITQKNMLIGAHIKEVELAKTLNVSRSPIRNAFSYLQESGYLNKRPNQGFFLAKLPDVQVAPKAQESSENSALAPICYEIGQDYLAGKLSKSFTENELISRYKMGRKAIQEALIAMEKDGWLKRNIGYGWGFNEFISSPTAYAQSYRFRHLIEPEAIRDPGFKVDHTTLQMLRMSQIDILNNDEKLVSAADMFNAGVLFHEAIVGMSGNVFLLDALRRVNRLRRLVEFNVNGKRPVPRQECEEHLRLIEMIEAGELQNAADFLGEHLSRTAREKEAIAQGLFGK